MVDVTGFESVTHRLAKVGNRTNSNPCNAVPNHAIPQEQTHLVVPRLLRELSSKTGPSREVEFTLPTPFSVSCAFLHNRVGKGRLTSGKEVLTHPPAP